MDGLVPARFGAAAPGGINVFGYDSQGRSFEASIPVLGSLHDMSPWFGHRPKRTNSMLGQVFAFAGQ